MRLGEALEQILEEVFRTKDHEEWLRRLAQADLPHGRVRSMAEVLAHPQVIARQVIREIESPVGQIPIIANPLRLSESPARYDQIPDLGGDNEAILQGLGYDDAAIAQLRRGFS